MKYIKSYILLALMVLAVTGCKQEDLKDDVNALKDRVTLLEEQVKLLNENIAFFSKVLVRQTVDNGDGTFTEVPAYSISEVLVNDGTTFTAKFNDGNVLTLTIGSKGTVTTPQLGVNPETGKWMLNGSDTGYSAVGTDSSVDGGKPEFKIMLDSSAQQYYWQVTFNGTDWQDVTDADGNRVYVTEVGGELAKDNLFEKAEVDGNEFVLTYYTDGQGSTAEVRIPIISDLSCVINVPEKDMADGYWEIGADGASAEVEIKGDHWFVIAPHGWEASISETLTDGKAILTVKKSTASAGLKSRATANNTDEVVVQVNKGMYWAVAKVKVREAVTSYFSQVYKAGKNIVVGEPGSENGYGLNINETEFADGQLLQNGASISDNGVYFIEEGATVTLGAISDLQSLVIVGNNPEKPSTVKVEANSFLLGATGGKGIVMKNVVLDAENAAFTNGGLISTKATSSNVSFDQIVFDGCEVNMPLNKMLVRFDLRPDNLAICKINNFAMYGIKVKLPATESGVNVYFIYTDASTSFTGCSSFICKNSIFYSAETGKALTSFGLLQANSTNGAFGKVVIMNNSFVNVLSPNMLMRAKIESALSVTNNLLWNNSEKTTARRVIGLLSDSNINSIAYGDNKAYDSSTDASKWNVFYKGDQYVYPDPIEGGNNLPIEAVDPFATEGGSMDWDAGIFVPGAGYENIGAHIN